MSLRTAVKVATSLGRLFYATGSFSIGYAIMNKTLEARNDAFIVKYEELFGEACQAARYPVKHENESVPSLLKRNAEKQEQISELLASIPPIRLPELMEIAEDASKETRHLIRSRNYLIESIAWLLRYQGLKVEGFPDEIPGKEKS